jgi:hypothetical protein
MSYFQTFIHWIYEDSLLNMSSEKSLDSFKTFFTDLLSMQFEQIYVEIWFIFIRLDPTDAIFHNVIQTVVKYNIFDDAKHFRLTN